MKQTQIQFIVKHKEVSEEHYDEMLGCLPPERMTGNAFLVGEASDHGGEKYAPRYAMYFMENGKFYYAGLATVKDFDLWNLPEYPCEKCGGKRDVEARICSLCKPDKGTPEYGQP